MLTRIRLVLISVAALQMAGVASAQSINSQGAQQFNSLLSSKGITVQPRPSRAPNVSTGVVGGAAIDSAARRGNAYMKSKGVSSVRRQAITNTGKAVGGRLLGPVKLFTPGRVDAPR